MDTQKTSFATYLKAVLIYIAGMVLVFGLWYLISLRGHSIPPDNLEAELHSALYQAVKQDYPAEENLALKDMSVQIIRKKSSGSLDVYLGKASGVSGEYYFFADLSRSPFSGLYRISPVITTNSNEPANFMIENNDFLLVFKITASTMPEEIEIKRQINSYDLWSTVVGVLVLCFSLYKYPVQKKPPPQS